MGCSQRFDLTGRTALITGAAGLLGVEHGAALIESGATVVLTDLDDAALTTANGFLAAKADRARILTRVMDVSRSFYRYTQDRQLIRHLKTDN